MNNEAKILEILVQIQADQAQMKEEISGMKGDISGMKGDISGMKGDISDLRTTVTRVAVPQENVVIPQIKLLAEGHDLLLQKLARKERVEALEDDVALLKSVVKTMSERITELEKAQ